MYGAPAPGQVGKKLCDIKWHPQEFDAELVPLTMHNGVLFPRRVPGSLFDPGSDAIQWQTNAARVKYPFGFVAEKKLLMRMSTDQYLRLRGVSEVFIQPLRRVNALQKRSERTMRGQQRCPVLLCQLL
jgi:hypothetical protein